MEDLPAPSRARVEAAGARAREAVTGAVFERRAAPRRIFAVGDPQTSDARFFSVLEAHGLLDDDGLLRQDVGLVSVGDHFDFKSSCALEEIGRQGERTLAWLCAHPAAQVTVLLGNHDVCRVMELWRIDDVGFAAARAMGSEIHERERRGEEPRALVEAFHARFSDLPTPETARRDWSSFATSQRARLQRLLLAGRLKLATTLPLGRGALEGNEAAGSGREALVTHACVSTRELDLLGLCADDGPRAIAAALNGALRDRVERVRAAWSEGRPAPLDLAPLHAAGTAGVEGGGLLYHRVVNPAAEETGDAASARRRRFPGSELPRGLVQVCGHTGHEKSVKHLAGWVTPAGSELGPGALRALVVGEGEPRYGPRALVDDARDGDAVVLFVDGKMNEAEPRRYELLVGESEPTDR